MNSGGVVRVKIYKMANGTEYVLESDMNEAGRVAFSQYQDQNIAQILIPDGLAEGDTAHYAWDWQRWRGLHNKNTA